ncbi:ComF family protein [Stieleria marina]|uniref:ComF family protein n=1 Tax=Stieleria marina TaxID=1930275 RepID=UPI003AF3BEC6
MPDAENAACGPSTFIQPCVHCKKEAFQIDQVIAKWTYQGKVCDAIIAAKYARQSALGNALGRQLGEHVATQIDGDPPQQITFVPSSFRRQWARGGRTGIIAIAQGVAHAIKAAAPVGSPNLNPNLAVKPLLRITRRIQKQAWLSDVERRKNVSGAFATKKGYAWRRDSPIFGTPEGRASVIANQHILVVDDVLTTGATANEIATVLRNAGARRVTLAVVARAVWSK